MTTDAPVDEELAALAAEASKLRADGNKVVLTNGCFDLLHPGHVDGLRRARELGDFLIVAINSDDSVRRLKGAGRPIVPLAERVELLLALRWVDRVVGFDAPTPIDVIRSLRPDIWVKGADWRGVETPEVTAVREGGGEVVYLDLVDGYSTTSLVERIRALPLTE